MTQQYQQSGINSVPIDTLVYDVKDFGASPGSSADTNSSSIQKAIDDASSLGGGIVYISPGTYILDTGGIELKSGVRLVGAGPGAPAPTRTVLKMVGLGP